MPTDPKAGTGDAAVRKRPPGPPDPPPRRVPDRGGQPRVLPENYWREVWHDNCAHEPAPPMRHLNEYLDVPEENDARLRLYECVVCKQRVFAGLNPKTRQVIDRPATPAPEGGAAASTTETAECEP